MKAELFVSLKTTDSTAITALNALKRMGMKIDSLERYDYYAFELAYDITEELNKCDILVNHNKHKVENSLLNSKTNILIEDNEPPKGLMNTLKTRLGFKEIEDMKKGVIWSLDENKEEAKKIAEALLYNKHYQKFEFLD